MRGVHSKRELVDQLRRHEIVAWLVGLLLVTLAVWAFVEIADEVMEGSTRAFDQRILHMLRAQDGAPIGPSWLPTMVRDITAMGSWAVLGLFTLAVVGFLLLSRQGSLAALVVLAMVSGQVASHLLKTLFSRERPDAALRLAEVASLSFPSGHSMLSVLLYLTLGAMLAQALPSRRTKLYVLACAVVLAGLIGLSRIYLGVHYPSDVLAGWSAGFAWAVLWWLVVRWWQQRQAPSDAR